MKKQAIVLLALALFVTIASTVSAHEKVKLTGYVVDVMCFAEHTKDLTDAARKDAANKAAAEHTKECALMEECIKSGYGIYADGKWYPFDAKGNELARALFEKTTRKDHLKMTVEGMKHDGKILVEKLTEAE
ncbi:MAG: hypothetical protein ACREEM_23810 [Blastocatellia bacterium]